MILLCCMLFIDAANQYADEVHGSFVYEKIRERSSGLQKIFQSSLIPAEIHIKFQSIWILWESDQPKHWVWSRWTFKWQHLKSCIDCLAGSVSTDGEQERVFISDTLHNRVIITDRDGTVIDCVRTALFSLLYSRHGCQKKVPFTLGIP